MQLKLVPSQIVGPVVPRALQARFGAQIDVALDRADAIMAGRDEASQSQRSAIIVFAIRIVSALIAYASQVLLARWLGGHEYGIFVWVWTLAIIVGGVSCLGFPSAVVRFVPEYQLAKDDASLRGIIFGSRLYAAATATGFAAAGLLLLYLFEDIIANGYVAPLYLAAICLPMIALGDVQEGVARAFNRIGLALTPKFLIRPVLILVAMVTALAAGWPATAETALGASVVAVWATAIGQMLMIEVKVAGKIASPGRSMQPRRWLTVALPIFLVEGFYVLLTSVDILIAGLYLPPAQVAVYFAAVKTLALVHFVYYAVRAASAHRYSHFFHAGSQSDYQAFVRDTIQWTFWPSLMMAAVILALGPFLLNLFGPGFSAGYPLLFVLVIGIIARSSVGPAESVLTMSGQQNVCAIVYAVTLLVNVSLNLLLIPVYGLEGAAWATTCSMIFEALALYGVAYRRLGLRLFVFARPLEQV